jgi:hypothetical protein
MNDASGLEPGKTTTIFAERKVIELPKRDKQFCLGTILRKTWNPDGCISATSPSFDEMFGNGGKIFDSPVPKRKVVVEKHVDTTTDHEVKRRLGIENYTIGFVDLLHLINADTEDPYSILPAIGPTYFFAKGLGYVTCLCELSRIEDGLRLHSHEITSRARPISGSVIYRESLVAG